MGERDDARRAIELLEEHLGRIGEACLRALGRPIREQAVFPLVQEVIAKFTVARADVAAAESRGRAAERERCAGMVEAASAEMLAKVDECQTELGKRARIMHVRRLDRLAVKMRGGDHG